MRSLKDGLGKLPEVLCLLPWLGNQEVFSEKRSHICIVVDRRRQYESNRKVFAVKRMIKQLIVLYPRRANDEGGWHGA